MRELGAWWREVEVRDRADPADVIDLTAPTGGSDAAADCAPAPPAGDPLAGPGAAPGAPAGERVPAPQPGTGSPMAPPRSGDLETATACWFHRRTGLHRGNLETLAERIEQFGQAPAPPGVPHDFHPGRPRVRLPPPRSPWRYLHRTLWATITGRRSCRDFTAARPPTPAELATLLAVGFGARAGEPWFCGTVPSAGGLQSLHLYLILPLTKPPGPGILHYHPRQRDAVMIVGGPGATTAAITAILADNLTGVVPLWLVITGRPEPLLEKYGARGYRFILLEAGHLAQNLMLAGEMLGLGSCALGGFDDHELAAGLAIDPAHEWPLYALAVGWGAR